MMDGTTLEDLDRRNVLKLGGSSLATALAGCTTGGSSGGGNSSSNGSKTGDLVTEDRIGSGSKSMTYWTITPHSHQDNNKNFANTIANDFYKPWGKNHKQFKIDYEIQPSYGQLQTKLAQAVAKNNAPPISIADSFWVPNYYKDLSPVTQQLPDTDDWFPFVKDVAKQNGEWRTVWQNTDCRALYYRQDMIDKHGSGEAPKTWDELIQVGKKIADNEDMNGFMYNGGRWEGTTFDNLAYYWGQGGEILTDKRNPALTKGDNKQKLQNVFEFLKRTVDSGVAPKRVASIKDYNLLTKAAINGDTAMFLGGNWQISSIKQEVDDWEKWKVAEIPQVEAKMSATGSGGWTQNVFTSKNKFLSAAKDFTTMFAEKDKMAAYAKAGGYLPTRPSIFEEFDYFADDPYQQKFGKFLENAQARPGGPIYKTFSSEFQIAAGKVLTDQASPAQVTNTLVQNVKSEHGN
ncbi:extracellular solute-binding protein [Halorussus salinisoli]|uniref:extracellular solute-binding protein n=1 Tax=Halorussus salinisoli TaxID=2558242 RepID=UPI0010C1EC7F|nr:extracellular solute-binding protein [Halorussus salinisoli]